MEEVVLVQIEPIDCCERLIDSMDLRDDHGSIEGGDGIRCQSHELIVQLQDLRPVRRRDAGRITVYGVDCGLNLIRTRLIVRYAETKQALSLGDEVAIPAAVVLISQQDHLPIRRQPGGTSRVDEKT